MPEELFVPSFFPLSSSNLFHRYFPGFSGATQSVRCSCGRGSVTEPGLLGPAEQSSAQRWVPEDRSMATKHSLGFTQCCFLCLSKDIADISVPAAEQWQRPSNSLFPLMIFAQIIPCSNSPFIGVSAAVSGQGHCELKFSFVREKEILFCSKWCTYILPWWPLTTSRTHHTWLPLQFSKKGRDQLKVKFRPVSPLEVVWGFCNVWLSSVKNFLKPARASFILYDMQLIKITQKHLL